jgi:flavin reductase (DIM6/NTAB) family NADH-FMN oxidoreductase RutF
MILECKVIHTHEIGLHTQFIGKIMDVKVDEEILNEKGVPRMDKVAPFVFGHGIREYWTLGETIGRGFDIGRKYSK